MAERSIAALFAQHQPDDYGGDSIQCQGCHPRRWFAGWREFSAHLASLSDERLAQAEAKVWRVEAAMAAFEKDVANPGASWVNTGMRALYNFRAALSGDAAPRTDGEA